MTQAASNTGTLQAIRTRNTLVQAVRTQLKGSGLDIRELENELAISNPGHPDQGHIYITYMTGDVSHRRTIWDYLGHLDTHPSTSPDAEPRITTEIIRATLTGEPGIPL